MKEGFTRKRSEGGMVVNNRNRRKAPRKRIMIREENIKAKKRRDGK